MIAVTAVPAGVARAATTPAPVAAHRLAGSDRYATAIAVSRTFDRASAAVVASGEAFPDAIAAAALAGALHGPILLTRRAVLPDGVLAELDRLGVTDVALVGGSDAIASSVEAEVAMGGRHVRRVAGPERVATAVAVAREVAASIGVVGGERAAFVARSDDFADALAAGAPGAAGVHPVLLTSPDALDPRVAEAIADLGIRRVFALGGESALSDSGVVAPLRTSGVHITRVAGHDRFDTAARVADVTVAADPNGFGFTGTSVAVASGLGFADALAAAPVAGRARQPVLLASDRLPVATQQWVADRYGNLDVLDVFGGPAAISVGDAGALVADPACQSLAASESGYRPVAAITIAALDGRRATPLNVYGGVVSVGWGYYATPGALCSFDHDGEFGIRSVHKVTALPDTVADVQLDATGSKAVVLAVIRDIDDAYYVLDATDVASGATTRLADHVTGAGEWSPDGLAVAFPGPKDTEGHGGIEVIRADGSGRHTVCPGFDADDLAWSPDGKRIAVSGPAGLRVCDAAGPALWDTAAARLSAPSWHPDGTRIAATRAAERTQPPYWHDPGPDLDVVVVDPNAAPSQTPRTLYGGDAYDEQPRWSPTGDALAFRRGPGKICTPLDRLEVATPPGAPPIAVAADGFDEPYADEYSWAPDGQHLVYRSALPHVIACQ
jgi:putative cell wall-binding protein